MASQDTNHQTTTEMNLGSHHLHQTSKEMRPEATQQEACLTGDRLPPRGLERPQGSVTLPGVWSLQMTSCPGPSATVTQPALTPCSLPGQRAENSKGPALGHSMLLLLRLQPPAGVWENLGCHRDGPWAAIYYLCELGMLDQNPHPLPQKWLTQLWVGGRTGQGSSWSKEQRVYRETSQTLG